MMTVRIGKSPSPTMGRLMKNLDIGLFPLHLAELAAYGLGLTCRLDGPFSRALGGPRVSPGFSPLFDNPHCCRRGSATFTSRCLPCCRCLTTADLVIALKFPETRAGNKQLRPLCGGPRQRIRHTCPGRRIFQELFSNKSGDADCTGILISPRGLRRILFPFWRRSCPVG